MTPPAMTPLHLAPSHPTVPVIVPSPSKPFPLLELPWDVRLLLYKAFVARDDGLFYEPETGELHTNDGKPFELPVLRTCRQVAVEMQGLFLSENTITVSTTTSPRLREMWDRWDSLYSETKKIREYMLAGIPKSLASTNCVERVAVKYPWFRAPLEAIMRPCNRFATNALSKRVSLLFFRDSHLHFHELDEAVQYTLRLASAAGDLFKEEASLALKRMRGYVRLGYRCDGYVFDTEIGDPFEIMDLQIDPRIMPTDEEYDRARDIVKGTSDMRFYTDRGCPYPARRGRLSASNVCLRLLRSLSLTKRAHLRRIRLVKDRPSGLFRPEFRGGLPGLVSYCTECPKLHIEQRVLLWNSVYTWALCLQGFAVELAVGLNRYIASAAKLHGLGMPRGSFTLVFDAQQSPEQATGVFQDFLHPDIAWAKAISLWETAHPPRYRALTTIESKDLVIQAVDELLAGTSSLIRCNFDPGRPVDVAPISAQLKGLTRLEVKQAFRRREPPVVQETRPPLPSWQGLADQWEERRPSTDPVPGYHVQRVPVNNDYDSDASENNRRHWESASDSGSDSGSDAASDMTEPTPDDLETFQKMENMDWDSRQHMPRRIYRARMSITIA